MADSPEHSPGPQPEHTPPPAENTSSASTKTTKQVLEELIVQNAKLETLKEELNKEDHIKDEKEQKKVRKMRNDLRSIIGRIRNPTSPADEIDLPPTVSKIIKELVLDEREKNNKKIAEKDKTKGIDQSQIDNDTAPVIYELLRISMPGSGYDFNTKAGMAAVLDVMVDISQFAPHIAAKIIKPLLEDAKAKGCTEDELEKADKLVNPKNYIKKEEELLTKQRERAASYDAAFAPIQGVVLGERAVERIRANIELTQRDALNSGSISRADVERIIEQRIAQETDAMRGEVSMALSELIGAMGTHTQNSETMKYNAKIGKLYSDGKISAADLEALQSLPENPKLSEYISSEYKKNEGNDLVQEAMRVFVPSDHQIKVLRAISSASSLKDFLRNEVDNQGNYLYLIGDEGISKDDKKINWKAFTKDIKGIFEELLDIADRNPNQFFEQAFNPMYEGHLYQVLLQRVTHLGAQVTSSAENGDEWFKNQEIAIEGETVTPSQKTQESPYKMNEYIKTSEYSFGVAIGNYLANNMNDYKMVREHLHNVNAICTQGLGWEQLKNYAERLDIDKIDRLMRQEDSLSLASNYYADALQKEVATKGRVVTPDFGRTDEVWQLNSAERMAFMQLKADLKGKKEYVGLSETALDRQAIQKIRMAAAISYGITGEFWNIMMTSRMPVGSEKAVNAYGEEIQKFNLPYTGTHHRGYEKMIGELDLDLVLQRFNIPRFYNDLRYVHSYRNLHHPPDAWSKEGWFNHKDVKDNRFSIEDAMLRGRSDEQIDKDEYSVYFMDFLRTKCVGMFARGGWRFTNWEVFKAYKDGDAHNRVDYVQTLANVRKMGTYITQRFLNELKPTDIEMMSREEIKVLVGLDKPGSQLTEADKKLFGIESLYEHVLFGQMANVIPTKFLQIQERRWTPNGERMLKEDLCDYLKRTVGVKYNYPDGTLNTDVYNMYLAALTLAEKSTWSDRREDNQNYEFGASDIDAHRLQLESFFAFYKTDKGVHNESGRKIEIHGDANEFIQTLKGFSAQLRKSIDAPRFHYTNNRGPAESLQKRFANMLNTKDGDAKGNIENLIGGDDFDAEHFLFGAAGGYAPARFTGETFGCTSKMNPAIGKLIFDILPEFTKSQFKDVHEVEKFMKEKMLPAFKDIHGAISNMDKNQADEYSIRLALFVSNLIGNDRAARIKVVGPMLEWWNRQRYGTQSSVYKEFFPDTLGHPSHGADSDEIFEMFHVLAQGLNIPAAEHEVDHYETTLSLFGRPIMTKPIYKEGHIEWNQEVMEKAAGLTGKTKWLETIIPVGGTAILLIMLAMAYLAAQKNKKK